MIQTTIRRVALTAAAALALLAPSAGAASTEFTVAGDVKVLLSDQVVTDSRLALFARAARVYWGRLPDCPLEWHRLVQVVSPEIDDYYDDPVGVADQGGCGLWVDTKQLSKLANPDACVVVVHEIGHLLGYDHDYSSRSGVMDSGGTPMECVSRRTTSLHDRKWCRRNVSTCLELQPRLAKRANVTMPAAVRHD